MDATVLYIVLGVMLFSLTLNLMLTLNIMRVIRRLPLANVQPLTPPLQAVIPSVPATLLHSKQRISFNAGQQPAVLVFLSSRCPKCEEKKAEVEALLPLADAAELHIWLVSSESSWRTKRFLSSMALQQRAVFTRQKHYKTLNPRQVSPFYLFIDHEARLQAGGTLGDDNWQSFREQMLAMQLPSGEQGE
ncbi:MAG TPA: hypothetical protein VFY01_12325 [Rheinheimera sp.]|nr:hypothetical protein [Rheinheimera sp.]